MLVFRASPVSLPSPVCPRSARSPVSSSSRMGISVQDPLRRIRQSGGAEGLPVIGSRRSASMFHVPASSHGPVCLAALVRGCTRAPLHPARTLLAAACPHPCTAPVLRPAANGGAPSAGATTRGLPDHPRPPVSPMTNTNRLRVAAQRASSHRAHIALRSVRWTWNMRAGRPSSVPSSHLRRLSRIHLDWSQSLQRHFPHGR